MVRAWDGDYGDDEGGRPVRIDQSDYDCTCPEPFGEDDLMCAGCEFAMLTAQGRADMAALGYPTDEEWAAFAARQG